MYYTYIITTTTATTTTGGRIREKCMSSYCRQWIVRSWWGYTIDLADNQWRELRQNLPTLMITGFVLVIIHSIICLGCNQYHYKKANKRITSSSKNNTSKKKKRLSNNIVDFWDETNEYGTRSGLYWMWCGVVWVGKCSVV